MLRYLKIAPCRPVRYLRRGLAARHCIGPRQRKDPDKILSLIDIDTENHLH